MDAFNADLLLSKEWLVQVDAHTSTRYLMKFHSSPVDLTCSLMVTDTKRTWAEGALSSKQLARRWRECNEPIDSPSLNDDAEEAWRTRTLDLLSRAHTLGGMPELVFELVEFKFGDFAFQLACSAFKWRWEMIFVGHKISAEILSKHLIMPLITVNHLAFSSSNVVGDLPPTDLDKAIDKVARTARRTADTHVKNALSKPRLATTIRRITAVFNFISDPPHTATAVDTPLLLAPAVLTPKIRCSPQPTRTLTPEPNDRRHTSTSSKRASLPIGHAADSGSATEPEDDPSVQPVKPRPGSGADRRAEDVRMASPPPASGARSRSISQARASDTESSPAQSTKKARKLRAPSSDEDSDGERTKEAAPIKRGATAPGLRQPIKRGGKRF